MSRKNIQNEKNLAKRLVGPQRYGVAPTSLIIEGKKNCSKTKSKNTDLRL